MSLVSLLSQADLAVALLIAIPLGMAALALLLAATVLVVLAGFVAAGWALRRANEAVLGAAAQP